MNLINIIGSYFKNKTVTLYAENGQSISKQSSPGCSPPIPVVFAPEVWFSGAGFSYWGNQELAKSFSAFCEASETHFVDVKQNVSFH